MFEESTELVFSTQRYSEHGIWILTVEHSLPKMNLTTLEPNDSLNRWREGKVTLGPGLLPSRELKSNISWKRTYCACFMFTIPFTHVNAIKVQEDFLKRISYLIPIDIMW